MEDSKTIPRNLTEGEWEELLGDLDLEIEHLDSILLKMIFRDIMTLIQSLRKEISELKARGEP